MVGKTKAATVAEQARIERIIARGCLACRTALAEQAQRTEAHHLLSGGRRRGHAFTVPLCGWHHRGEPPPGWNTKQAREAFGPSLRLESRAFHERYGSDDELLARVNELICEPITEAA
jgi:hypothetical protein